LLGKRSCHTTATIKNTFFLILIQKSKQKKMPYDIIVGRNKTDKERFGDKGLVYTGKGYVTMGNYTSLSNLIWVDVARSHVIMVAGKRGS